MRRLLILTYCFPPCNLAPTRRVLPWVECLPQFGWYPIVVCRHWSPEDADNPVSAYTAATVVHEHHDTHEVHWVPYYPNLRDRILDRFGLDGIVPARRAVSYAMSALEKVSPRFDALRGYGAFVRGYLEQHQVDGILVTGNPFVLFRVGYQAHRRFGVPWAADYRDAWTANTLAYPASVAGTLLRHFDRRFERRWLETASFFTTISPEYVRQIRSVIGRPGYTIYNGYSPSVAGSIPAEGLYDTFTVSYVGTLYPMQRIEVFLRGVIRFLESAGDAPRFQMLFPGITHQKGQRERVLALVRRFERYFTLTDRIPGADAVRLQARSHLLLQVGWNAEEGVVGSKVFEYLGAGRPIVICPSDRGVLERTITRMRAGYVADSEAEVSTLLQRLYAEYLRTGTVEAPHLESAAFYSRTHQVKRLARSLDAHFGRHSASPAPNLRSFSPPARSRG